MVKILVKFQNILPVILSDINILKQINIKYQIYDFTYPVYDEVSLLI